jgi:hypothetical protein
MFIGHFGLGLAGKALAPRVSLATWFMSVELLDLLWPVFLLLGWEHVRIAPGITRMTPLDLYDYPISHSLVGALAWSALFAALYGLWRSWSRWRVAALLGLGVLSHWVLDLLVHRPDLPVLPHGPYVGLGLWNLPAVEAPLEVALYAGGAILYLRATRPRQPGAAIGRYATWLLLLVLAAFWVAATLGPPPPDERSLAWGSLCIWLFVLWAGWCDRRRASVEPELPAAPAVPAP